MTNTKTSLVQITSEETLEDLKYIKELLESQTGMRVSYQNVVNLLIKKYLQEKP